MNFEDQNARIAKLQTSVYYEIVDLLNDVKMKSVVLIENSLHMKKILLSMRHSTISLP